jgi:hypothetical protein
MMIYGGLREIVFVNEQQKSRQPFDQRLHCRVNLRCLGVVHGCFYAAATTQAKADHAETSKH